MKFGITGWMLLVWSVNLVHGAPCQSFLTIEACQGNTTTSSTATSSIQCVWCEASSTCGSDMTQCDTTSSEPVEGVTNGNSTGMDTCHALNSQGNCTASAGCVWCSDIEVCTSNGDECDNFVDSEGCSTENCTQGEDGAPPMPGCNDANCTFADGGGSTSDGSQEDQMTEDKNVCRSLETEANCTTVDNCLWCSDQGKCRSDAMGCNRGGGDGEGGGGSEGEGEGDGGGGRDGENWNKCFPIGNETECAETAMCFWCAEHDVCRPTFGSCPGNEGTSRKTNLCLPLRNETVCLESGSCFWCDDASLCRPSEEQCPGRGRINICKQLPERVCDLGDGCTWWHQQGRCGTQRGVPKERGNFTEDDDGSACPLMSDEGNCTMQFHCRWCPGDEKCQSAFDMCDDGTIGARGNPCQQAAIEDVCTNIIGCLWCDESSKCKKATIQGCNIDDGDNGNSTLGNLCIVHDLQIECEEVDDCKWCDGQSKCKKNEVACDDPSGDVDIAIDENDAPGFQIRDDGLGATDPYAVTVTLNYLYEVTAEGKTIEASLVDLEPQEYNVKQTVGSFFGNAIQARRIQFETTIDGVGTIALEAFIMLDDGNITTPGMESWVVAAGDVKFNVDLSNWTFCGDQTSCGDSNETSEYIDLAFSIRGYSRTPQENDDNALVFNLGGNVPLLLSSEIEVDEFMQEMPDGFPRAENTDSQGTVFMFRFPRFKEGVSYDPIIPYHYALSVLQGQVEPTVPPVLVVPTNIPKPPTAPPTFVPVAPLPPPPEPPAGLSGGAIAGIVIGALCALCCCCAGIGYASTRKKGEESRGYQVAGSDEKNNVTLDDDEFEDESNRHRHHHDHHNDRHHSSRRRHDDEEEGSSGTDSNEEEDKGGKHKQGYSSSSSENSDISTSDSE